MSIVDSCVKFVSAYFAAGTSQASKQARLLRERHLCMCSVHIQFLSMYTRTTDTQWRHKPKIYENLGRCGRQNMLRPYLKIWDWEWIFGRAVKTISYLDVRSPWFEVQIMCAESVTECFSYWKQINCIPLPLFSGKTRKKWLENLILSVWKG